MLASLRNALTSSLKTIQDALPDIDGEEEVENENKVQLDSIFAALHQDVKNQKADGDEEDEGVRKKKPFTEARWFLTIVYSAIVVNAIQMGVEVDYPQYATLYKYLEHILTLLFVIEMICKWYTERWGYFQSGWNLLDCFLVSLAVFDLYIYEPIAGGESEAGQLSVLRLFRVLRIVRMMRLLKIFKDLWLIIKGLLASVGVVGWVSLLLIIALYICAIFCVQTIGESDLYVGRSEDTMNFPEVQGFNNYQFFGTIPRSMFTLWNLAILVGDWDTVARAVIEQQPELFLFFLVFIMFMTFGVMNVIIGVIVDNTMAAAKSVKDDESKIEKQKMLLAFAELRDVVTSFDLDSDGFITAEEISKGLKDPSVRGKMKELAKYLPKLWDAEELFLLLDSSGAGKISTDSFLRSAFRIIDPPQGHASMNVALISLRRLLSISRGNLQRLDVLRDVVERISSDCGVSGGGGVVVGATNSVAPVASVVQPQVPENTVPILHQSQTSPRSSQSTPRSGRRELQKMPPVAEMHNGASHSSSNAANELRIQRLERLIERTRSADRAAHSQVRMLLANMAMELPQGRSPQKTSASPAKNPLLAPVGRDVYGSSVSGSENNAEKEIWRYSNSERSMPASQLSVNRIAPYGSQNGERLGTEPRKEKSALTKEQHNGHVEGGKSMHNKHDKNGSDHGHKDGHSHVAPNGNHSTIQPAPRDSSRGCCGIFADDDENPRTPYHASDASATDSSTDHDHKRRGDRYHTRGNDTSQGSDAAKSRSRNGTPRTGKESARSRSRDDEDERKKWY